jgi:hypothetical protein
MDQNINNLIGLKGGKDETFFEILAVQEAEIIRYPSIKDGQELSYPLCGTEKEHEEYWNHKQKTVSKGYHLIVTGNAVSCEDTLKSMNYNAFASGPNLVEVIS